MRKIVITPRGFARYGEEELRILREGGFTVDYNNTGKAYTVEEFYSHCAEAEGLIVGVEKVDRDFIDACPRLKAVVKFGIGTDNIDIPYCREKGIYVGRCAGTNSRSVAEMALTYILAETKNLYQSFFETKNGGWNKATGCEVMGKTLGIIGFGAVGKHLAKMAKGLEMRVLIYDVLPIDPDLAKEYGAEIADLETIYKTADFTSLHVPLTEETRDMISLKEMRMMKRSCVLINTSRGGIVSEKDLYLALSEKIIRAAYFDVFSSEPPAPDEPLLRLDNFYLTPHTASRAAEAEKRTCQVSARLILEALG